MALGKRSGSEVELGSGIVQYTRSSSGKRIAISSNMEAEIINQFEKEVKISPEKLELESLPQDILVRILYGVDHEDLKQLFHVSKVIREATILAKKLHFDVSTPTKKNVGMRFFQDDADEVEAPNAPKQQRMPKLRVSFKKLASLSVALFASSEEAQPKNNLVSEMESENYVL